MTRSPLAKDELLLSSYRDRVSQPTAKRTRTARSKTHIQRLLIMPGREGCPEQKDLKLSPLVRKLNV